MSATVDIMPTGTITATSKHNRHNNPDTTRSKLENLYSLSSQIDSEIYYGCLSLTQFDSFRLSSTQKYIYFASLRLMPYKEITTPFPWKYIVANSRRGKLNGIKGNIEENARLGGKKFKAGRKNLREKKEKREEKWKKSKKNHSNSNEITMFS